MQAQICLSKGRWPCKGFPSYNKPCFWQGIRDSYLVLTNLTSQLTAGKHKGKAVLVRLYLQSVEEGCPCSCIQRYGRNTEGGKAVWVRNHNAGKHISPCPLPGLFWRVCTSPHKILLAVLEYRCSHLYFRKKCVRSWPPKCWKSQELDSPTWSKCASFFQPIHKQLVILEFHWCYCFLHGPTVQSLDLANFIRYYDVRRNKENVALILD